MNLSFIKKITILLFCFFSGFSHASLPKCDTSTCNCSWVDPDGPCSVSNASTKCENDFCDNPPTNTCSSTCGDWVAASDMDKSACQS